MLDSFSHGGVSVKVDHAMSHSDGSAVFSADVRVGKKSAGTISMGVDRDGTVEWDLIEIAPAAQGKGFGSALLKRMIPLLKAGGAKAITLQAHSDSEVKDKMVGAAVWGKLGFDMKGIKQPDMASVMSSYSKATGFKWPAGLVSRVRSGKASIREVMDADPGDFLNATGDGTGVVRWDGRMDLNGVSLTASAIEVSYDDLGDAFERYLGRRRSGSVVSRSKSVFEVALSVGAVR